MSARKLPSLSALRAFEAAARHRSAKAAAQELSVTPTAISHQLRQLEDYLGVALFVRERPELIGLSYLLNPFGVGCTVALSTQSLQLQPLGDRGRLGMTRLRGSPPFV